MIKENIYMTKYLSHSNKYPYLVIHAMSGVYAVKHPKNPHLNKEQMIQWAKDESVKWNRGTCAVLSSNEAIYIELDSTVKYSNDIPAGGIILTDESEVKKEIDENPLINYLREGGQLRD